MKVAICALVVLAAFCSILYAQQTNSKQPANAFIEIGSAKLRLGMSKSEVAEKLVGSSITKMNEDLWVVGNGLSPSMQFTNGYLSFADRSWSPSGDIAESLFGVVSSFNSEGYSVCEVTADTKTSPDTTAQRVWIDCGGKKILVFRTSINGKWYSWVTEQLGSMRRSPN